MALFHQSFRYSKSSMHQSKQNKNSHWRNIFQHFLGDNDVDDCKTNDAPLIDTTKSVHLQLGQIVELRDDNHTCALVREESNEDHDDDENDDDEEDLSSNTVQSIIIHEYASTVDNATILASFGSKLKLEHFSVHVYGMNYSAHHNMTYRRVIMNENDSSLVEKYMSLWKDGKYLAASKYIRRDWKTSRDNRDQYRVSLEDTISSNIVRMKLLRSDTETLPILSRHLQKQVIRAKHSDHYYYNANRATNESLAVLKEFSLWFREQFPYYYDQCYHCGNKENNSYLGTVFPSSEELAYTASRTELYLCGSCITSSRFPRFNTVSKILDTRRGRCGEYSILMMLFLDCLGYVTRWVVDREDHVMTDYELDLPCLRWLIESLINIHGCNAVGLD